MEKWRDIPGYIGIYEVSNEGRIRTKEGKTTESVLHGTRHWKQRILKQKYVKRKNGKTEDAQVTLWKNKEPHYHLVSRLVAMAWCEGYSENLTVNHIDGNPKNNNCKNLEWMTIKENIQLAFNSKQYTHAIPTEIIECDGTIKHFRSMSEASKYLGKYTNYISDIIRKQRN